ncbi:MAG: type VI secretion system baseplate subunit TssK [Candidatus Eisenbacteria bacterium]
MERRTRVVWSEGLLLSPQHFQLQDRFHEERGAELYRAARLFGHGFSRLALDRDAIRNGRVVLNEAAGVLPGGMPFAIPGRDPVPPAREIEKSFSLETDLLPVHLGLRLPREGEIEIGPGTDARFNTLTLEASDGTGTGGTLRRSVEIARANFRILFPGDPLGEYETLPLAQIVRRPEGGFDYRADFISPCIAIDASERLQQVLRRLLEHLLAKSSELADRRRMSGKGVAEFGRDDTAGFWLLGVVNGSIPLISHALRSGDMHPEVAYRILISLAGQLTTLSDAQVRDLPPYDHDRLESTFVDLMDRIPRLLETVLPRHYTRIPLTQRDAYVHAGTIQDDRLIDPAMPIFLGVYANAPASHIQSLFPEMAKVASPDRLESLVAAALKGTPLRLVQTLPAALPAQAGWTYFQVEKSGEFWEGIAGSRQIAIYAPPEFPGILLELIAVRN